MKKIVLLFVLAFLISCSDSSDENAIVPEQTKEQKLEELVTTDNIEENTDPSSIGDELVFANDYEEAMYMAVKFFGGQRCGNTYNWMLKENEDIEGDRVCHVKDEFEGHDITGGWHDCGDHIKVAHTMGFSALMLLTAYDVWPKAFKDYYSTVYGKADGIPDVLNEVKIATDYFMKSFPDPNTFIYYVGNGNLDHKRWINSAEQSTLSITSGGESTGSRPAKATSESGGSTAAKYSAALTLMSISYAEFDQEYADLCLEYAKQIYEFSKNNYSETVVINPFYPYVSESWWDELSLSAVLLYRATENEDYKDDALDYSRSKGESNYPESWDTVADITYYYMVKYEANYSQTKTLLVKNVIVGMESTTSYGLPWNWEGLSDWGTNKLFCGSAFAAALYGQSLKDDVIGSELRDVSESAAFEYNKKIVDYMLGDNEYGHPFIHGFKGDMEHRIHHRNAMGRTFKDGEYTSTEEKNSLPFRFASGGLIGGPLEEGSFSNIVEGDGDFKETEGGCDYNASFVAALANIIANQ